MFYPEEDIGREEDAGREGILGLVTVETKGATALLCADAMCFTPASGNEYTLAEIANAVLAQLVATTIPVDAQKMNGANIIGVGSEADPWRGEGVPP